MIIIQSEQSGPVNVTKGRDFSKLMCFQRKNTSFLLKYSQGISSTSSKYILSHLSTVINWLSPMGLRKLLEWALSASFTERQQFMILPEQNKTEVWRPSISLSKKITLNVYSRDMHISQDTFFKRRGTTKKKVWKKIKCQNWSHQLGREVICPIVA